MVCTVCQSNAEGKVVFTEFGIDILRCRVCGHVMSSHQTSQHYDAYFDEPGRLDEFWWDQAHRPMYADFCRNLLPSKTGRLLDVGAGLGYFVRTVCRDSGWEAFGSEISVGAVRYARDVLGVTSITCGKLEDSTYSPSSFDLVTLWDVIEHVQNPDLMLQTIAALLKPKGTLFLHTPNAPVQLFKARIKKAIRGERADGHYLEARDHVNLYSAAGITTVLERCGYSDVTFRHLSPIQSVAGSDSVIFRMLKNSYFLAARSLSRATGGKLNIDNIFVTAIKH